MRSTLPFQSGAVMASTPSIFVFVISTFESWVFVSRWVVLRSPRAPQAAFADYQGVMALSEISAEEVPKQMTKSSCQHCNQEGHPVVSLLCL